MCSSSTQCVCPSIQRLPGFKKTLSHSAGFSPYGKALISNADPSIEHFQFSRMIAVRNPL